jgi:hypothetical protein
MILATQPLRDRLEEARRSAEAQAKADPRHADLVAESLIDNPDFAAGLEIMDELFDQEDPVRQGFRDDLAEQVLSALTAFANKTEQWDIVIPLLRRALGIPAATRAKERIQQALETATKSAGTDLNWRMAGYWELPEQTVHELERPGTLSSWGLQRAVQALENLHKAQGSAMVVGLLGALPFSLRRANGRMDKAFKPLETAPT